MPTVKRQGFLYTFIVRWLVTSLGLWVAAGILRGSVDYQGQITVIIVAGAILALINSIIKPLLVLTTLPIILLTLGIFMLLINGATVYLVSRLYPPLHIDSFGVAILTGAIIGLVNYLVTAILERR